MLKIIILIYKLQINLDEEGAEEALIGLLESPEKEPKDLEMANNQRKFKPIEYEIYIKPFLDNNTYQQFEGNVTIKLDVEKPTKSIILHSKDLNIKQVLVTYQSSNIIRPLVSASLITEDVDKENVTTNGTSSNEENMEENKNTTDINDNAEIITTSLPEIENKDNDIKEKVSETEEEITVMPDKTTTPKTLTTTEEIKIFDEPKVKDIQKNATDDKPIKRKEEQVDKEQPQNITNSANIKEQPSNETASENITVSSSPSPDSVSSSEKSNIETSAEPVLIDENENTVVMKSRMWSGPYKLRIDFDEQRLLPGIKYSINVIFHGSLSNKFGVVKNEYLNEETKNKRFVITLLHSLLIFLVQLNKFVFGS